MHYVCVRVHRRLLSVCWCLVPAAWSLQLSMYEARGKVEEASALYQIATKKFPGSKKVCVRATSASVCLHSSCGIHFAAALACPCCCVRVRARVIGCFVPLELRSSGAIGLSSWSSQAVLRMDALC